MQASWDVGNGSFRKEGVEHRRSHSILSKLVNSKPIYGDFEQLRIIYIHGREFSDLIKVTRVWAAGAVARPVWRSYRSEFSENPVKRRKEQVLSAGDRTGPHDAGTSKRSRQEIHLSALTQRTVDSVGCEVRIRGLGNGEQPLPPASAPLSICIAELDGICGEAYARASGQSRSSVQSKNTEVSCSSCRMSRGECRGWI